MILNSKQRTLKNLDFSEVFRQDMPVARRVELNLIIATTLGCVFRVDFA